MEKVTLEELKKENSKLKEENSALRKSNLILEHEKKEALKEVRNIENKIETVKRNNESWSYLD